MLRNQTSIMEETLILPATSHGDKEAERTREDTMISNLPRQCGWMYVPLSLYEGFWNSELFLKGIIRAQKLDSSHLNLSPSDVLICSIPKSGITWLKSLSFSIATRTSFHPQSREHPLLTSFSHELIPFIEINLAQNQKPRNPNIPLLSTHMPYSALPKSVSDSGCKIIYLCRNPKDVFVSFWLYMKKNQGIKEDVGLENAFDLFCQGVSPYGPYWNHVLEYWKASLERPDRILFLKYEEMMKDIVSSVKRMAEFMGYPFSELEEMEGVPTKLAQLCSFESLSTLDVNKAGKQFIRNGDGEEMMSIQNSTYFRKAKVGDWRNHLTDAMANKLDKIILENFDSSGLTL